MGANKELYLWFLFSGTGNTASNKLEEARKKREERKLARQRELEAKRAAKLINNKPPAKKIT